jgi:hypothetical protein
VARRQSLILLSQGFVPRELVAGEVNWFYSNLGIDDTYFQNESREVISDHIIALFGAKIMAFTKHDPSTLVIDLERIDERGNGATFIHTSAPGLTTTAGPGATCETRSVLIFISVLVSGARYLRLYLALARMTIPPTTTHICESVGFMLIICAIELTSYFWTNPRLRMPIV